MALASVPGKGGDRMAVNKSQFVSPRVVHLGATLPSTKLHYVTELWVPTVTTSPVPHSKIKPDPNPKNPRYRNLFEYHQKHKNKFNMKNKYWKLPSYSNNVIPASKSKRPGSIRDSGMTERRFQEWYHKALNNESDDIVLPPLITPTNDRPDFDLSKSPRRVGKTKEASSKEELSLPDVHSPVGLKRLLNNVGNSHTEREATRSKFSSPPLLKKNPPATGRPVAHSSML